MNRNSKRNAIGALAIGFALASVPQDTQAIVIVPAGYTDSFVATLPGPFSNFYGNVAVDASGNRYVTGGSFSGVYKVTAGGAVSPFAMTPGLALGLEIVGSDLYVGSESRNLNRVTLGPLPVNTTLSQIPFGSSPMGLALLPDGNSLFISNANGALFRYDIAGNSIFTTSVQGGIYPSIAVGQNGKLLIADYNNSSVIEYDPALNTNSVWRSGLGSVAGLAVDRVTGEVYAALEATGELMRISPDGATASLFASGFPVDAPGFYPTALEFAPGGVDLYYLDQHLPSSFDLRVISGFAPVSTINGVPEPSTLALLGSGFLGLALVRRRRRRKLAARRAEPNRPA